MSKKENAEKQLQKEQIRRMREEEPETEPVVEAPAVAEEEPADDAD